MDMEKIIKYITQAVDDIIDKDFNGDIEEFHKFVNSNSEEIGNNLIIEMLKGV